MARTYKTWEVIKELTENPKSIFKNQENQIIQLTGDGMVDIRDKKRPFYSIGDIWVRAQEPVTFMEALESGKWVKVEYDIIQPERFLGRYENITITRWNPIDRLLYILSNSLGAVELKKVILEGKWYVKEDEDV